MNSRYRRNKIYGLFQYRHEFVAVYSIIIEDDGQQHRYSL